MMGGRFAVGAPALKASGLGLARNEAGIRFTHVEDASALQDLEQRVETALRQGEWDEPWTVYDLSEVSSVELSYMVERGFMTPGFAEAAGEGRGFAVYGEGTASLEIGGVDHLRLLAFRVGDELSPLWSLVSQLDDNLEPTVSYAFDPCWGYLTAYPTEAGSGLRAYATLHVPSLMLTGRLGGVALQLVTSGYALSPLWGGAGGMIQVSNVGRQGKPEIETIQEIEDISRDIIEKERSVRKMFLRENPIQVRDHMGRAIGLAQHAWNMSFSESVNLLSAVEVGLELGLVDLPGLGNESPFDIMRRLQPAHVVMERMDGKVGDLDSPEVDQVRAQLMREIFSGACVLS
jgi:protein arginine kinase